METDKTPDYYFNDTLKLFYKVERKNTYSN